MESFDYFYEQFPEVLDEEVEGDFYPDGVNHVMILHAQINTPEFVENPEYSRGMKRDGSFLYELADPYSGCDLLLTETIVDMPPAPRWASAAYLLKAAAWTALAVWLTVKAGKNEKEI